MSDFLSVVWGLTGIGLLIAGAATGTDELGLYALVAFAFALLYDIKADLDHLRKGR